MGVENSLRKSTLLSYKINEKLLELDSHGIVHHHRIMHNLRESKTICKFKNFSKTKSATAKAVPISVHLLTTLSSSSSLSFIYAYLR